MIQCRKEPQKPRHNSGEHSAIPSANIVKRTIKGMVLNLCTSEGLADEPVFLEIRQPLTSKLTYSVTSDALGHFSFDSIPLPTHPEAEFSLLIKDKFIVGPKVNSCSLTGSRMFVSWEGTNKFLKPPAVPNMTNIYLYLINDGTADSLTFVLSQEYYHKNRPDFPYQIFGKIFPTKKYLREQSTSYPMGMYQIAISVWKNGKSENRLDSIYVGRCDTASYVIKW